MSQIPPRIDTLRNIIAETKMKPQLKILRYLAASGPLDKYQIKKDCRLYRSTVYKCAKRLQQKGFLWPNPEERSQKGMMRKPYRLTLAGLAKAFEDKELWAYVEEIVEKWNDLAPLVFGNWGYFKKRRLGEEATNRLKQIFQGEVVRDFSSARRKLPIGLDHPYCLYVGLLWSWLLHPLEDSPEGQSDVGSMPAMLFAEFFFLPMLDPLFRFSHEEWLKALRENPELKEWTMLVLKAQVSERRSSAERYGQLLLKLESSGR